MIHFELQIANVFNNISSHPCDHHSFRKFRVLIVLGCDIIMTDLPGDTPYFDQSYMFSVAFLYKHLFKYLYNFQDNQILITNNSDDQFRTYSTQSFQYSPPREGFYSKNSTNSTLNDD